MNENMTSVGKKLLVYTLQVSVQGLITSLIVAVIYSSVSQEPLLSMKTLLLIGVIEIGFIASGFINFARFAKPFQEIERFVGQIAGGVLNDKVSYKKLGPLMTIAAPLEKMQHSLVAMMGEIQAQSLSVTNHSGTLGHQAASSQEDFTEISHGITEIQEAVYAQAASLQEASTVMTEMAAGVQRIAESAASVGETTHLSNSKIMESQEDISTAADQMKEISTSFHDLKSVMTEFIQMNKNVENIVGVIRSISEQTNLLSLNASIEAARAGEHGKGFAVVAQEVGKLANETNASTEEIAQLIKQVHEKAAQSLQAMNETNDQVNKGITTVETVQHQFQDILSSSEEINKRVQDITGVSQEIAAGTEEVSASILDMNGQSSSSVEELSKFMGKVEGQTQSVEEVAVLSNDLKNISEKLNQLIRKFEI
ncbi:hypothetical protein GJU40_08635 [Bacillus lacus]|uniref:Methyl-accepting transducer domain-containing protein n=1 Tax=Metabacillus lacus TaxID=1983721 RepID=A0A7X2LYD0_9BACI|nr:methyl-accepting chemotaxis protein [Metabacillus lacus]MRX72216.1 hypothetical protein [Metabacillus lacus]